MAANCSKPRKLIGLYSQRTRSPTRFSGFASILCSIKFGGQLPVLTLTRLSLAEFQSKHRCN